VSVYLARRLMSQLPAGGGWPPLLADVVVLVLLLDVRDMAVHEIRDTLGIPQATAHDLVTRAEAIGLVHRYRETMAIPRRTGARQVARTDGLDARVTIVGLTARGKRMRACRRARVRRSNPS
jgi:hypothetical protein